MKRSASTLLILAIILCGFSELLIITPIEVSAQYTPHANIEIEGDEDFAFQASNEGWPGDGTEGNPYIIQDYEINASRENGIEIRSTTVHFIIKDIRIIFDGRFGDTGILLIYVQNGIIDGCQINVGHSGLHIMSCSNISIINNYIDSNGIGDIRISTSTDFTITNNYMMGTGLNINGNYLKEQDSHSIHNNSLHGKPIYYWINRVDGLVPQGAGQVFLINCTNVTVTGQEITDTYVGIGLHYSNNNTIMNNNIIIRDGNGISLKRSDNNNILNNKISLEEYNSRGIYLISSDKNNILSNVISNGTSGIEISGSVENIVKNNTMKENGIEIWGHRDKYYNSHIIDLSNTVNGKPVYYWTNKTNVSIPSYAGQVIIVDCRDVVIENLKITNTTTAITIGYSANITVRDNVLHSNELSGIEIYDSDECTLVGNDIQDNRDGVRLYYSHTNGILSNTIKNNVDGIVSLYSLGNSISNNNISNRDEGIRLQESHLNIIENNNISESYQSGIVLRDSLANDIRTNIFFNNGMAFKIRDSDSNNIIGNNITASDGGREGFRFWFSNDNLIMDNIVFGYEEGIYITDSQGISILNNNFSNSNNDVEIEGSSNINISNNIMSEINVFNSQEINIIGNIMENGRGIEISECLRSNVSNNLLNKSNGIIVKDCNESVIWNNSVSYGETGISIESCSNALVSENVLIDNVVGIGFYVVTDSILKNNRIAYHGGCGIEIEESHRNHIVGNIIWENRFGMTLRGTSDNIIHHNQFLANSDQVDQKGDNENTWDDGLGEGNFWDDYKGFDTNGDGVGDTELPHHEVDNFPLTDKKVSEIDDTLFFLVIYFTILLITLIIIAWIYKKRKSKGGSSDEVEGILPREL